MLVIWFCVKRALPREKIQSKVILRWGCVTFLEGQQNKTPFLQEKCRATQIHDK